MRLDLEYLRAEDRMRFSVKGEVDWLFTRSLLLKVVAAWAKRLEEVGLPDVGLPLGERNLRLEHELSLEFDGPTNSTRAMSISKCMNLVRLVNITVDALGSKLEIQIDAVTTTLVLTLKESHIILELFARKVNSARWNKSVAWPEWLSNPH